MGIFLFVASSMVTWILAHFRHSLGKRGLRQTWQYRLSANLLAFVAPCAGASALFLVLLVWAHRAAGADSTTLDKLITLEQLLDQATFLVGLVKLDAVQTLWILLGLLLLSVTATSLGSTLLRWFGRIQNVIRFLYIFVVLLAALTLFGSQLGRPSSQLRVRIATLRQGYAELKVDLSAAVTEEAIRAILERQIEALPPAYTDALQLPRQIAEASRDLADAYESAQREYKFADDGVAATINSAHSDPGASEFVVLTGTATRRESRVEPSGVPGDLSYGRLRRAREATDQIVRRQSTPEFVKLLDLEAGRKVVCQVPKAITEGLKKTAFDGVLHEFPILEPLVDAFVRTVDQEVEGSITAAIDRTTRRVIDNPEVAPDAVRAEAAQVAAKHEPVPIVVAGGARAEADLRAELSSLNEAAVALQARVRQERCDQLLAGLSSASESARTSAVEGLVEHSADLSPAQSERLLDIMRTGTEEWEIFVDQEWEGAYCYKRFRMKSIREYAAEAIERGSPQGSSQAVAARDSKSAEAEHISYFTRTYI